MSTAWKSLLYTRKDIQLLPVLLGGQSFRWRSLVEDEYIGVFNKSVWMLKQCDEVIEFKVINQKGKDDQEKTLKSYFRLDVDLHGLYDGWIRADSIFAEAAKKFYGIRMLRQEVIENIFSFICSSHNNITRISSMIEKLCRLYGSPIITELTDEEFYAFPDVCNMVGPLVETELRKAGFGYRAKFIAQTALMINDIGQEKWIEKIKSLPYEDAKAELVKLPGIGAKVADCICLMSLDHLQAIPVDTHVFQIAKSRYLPNLSGTKTVTNRVYNEIADHFRKMFGDYAGWAHTILFCDDLKLFKKEIKGTKRKTENMNKEKSVKKR